MYININISYAKISINFKVKILLAKNIDLDLLIVYRDYLDPNKWKKEAKTCLLIFRNLHFVRVLKFLV